MRTGVRQIVFLGRETSHTHLDKDGHAPKHYLGTLVVANLHDSLPR